MKKFISIFLVISIMTCNLNAGVVEALSSYINEVKLLANTLTNIEKEETVVGIESDKNSDKETEQVEVSNDTPNTETLNLKDKEKVEKSLDKTSSNINNKVDNKQIVTLTYDMTNGDYQVDNEDISEPDEVKFIIKGTGNGEEIYVDNYACDIPFNIEFDNINATNCHFLFENIKSISIKGNNTITNSYSDEPALEYSFNYIDENPLKMDEDSSFAVYNEDNTINNNIVCYGYSGNASIINMSFKSDLSNKKNFILDPISNKESTPKKFSTKANCQGVSILVSGDEESYVLEEVGNESEVYYYKANNGMIKTKFILKNGVDQTYYDIDNKQGIQVIVNKTSKEYKLVDTLKEALSVCTNSQGLTCEVIFLGNYNISKDDVDAIKNYEGNTGGIIFKTRIDDFVYSLNIGMDIELMPSNSNKFSVSFSDINFNYTSSGRWICSNGRPLTFGQDVTMKGQNYPSISLGYLPVSQEQATSTHLNSLYDKSSLTINSGTYGFITGDSYGTLQNIDIVIYNGHFMNEVGVVSGNLQNKNIINNVTLTIDGGVFESKVYGVGTNSHINGNLDITINGGNFKDLVTAVDGEVGNNTELSINGGTFIEEVVLVTGKVGKDAALTIGNNNQMFRSIVLGASSESDIGGSLNISINGGIFRSDVIGVYSDVATTDIEKVTLKGLLDRYSFSNIKRTNDKVHGNYSDTSNAFNVNIEIVRGSFRGDLIGNGKSTINILGSVNIPSIRNFDKLSVGSKTKKATLTVQNRLDKGDSIGDLYLSNKSKISFKSNTETSELQNIVLDGEGNILELPCVNRNKDVVLINLSGSIQNNSKKLNIQLNGKNDISEIYLMKFDETLNSDVEGKYSPQEGYYVHDEKNENGDLSGYVVLNPQTIFDLEYNFDDKKLYMIDKNNNNGNNKSEAWWYAGNTQDTENINLDTNELYKYKGYNLFKDSKNTVDRNIILKGKGSNKNVIVKSNLNNVNVVLDNIDLTNSNITLNDLKSLKVNGVNNINNIDNMNSNKAVFTYTFKDNQISDKVLFGDESSYLKIFTNKETTPFNGVEGNCMDLKFHEPFSEQYNKVRLKNSNREYKFDIFDNTERLGLLLKYEGDYNLYYGEGDTSGSSVYVAGNTEETFTETFKTASLNNIDVYEDVRRANPVSTIDVEMPSDVNFGVRIETDKLDRINTDNWKYYFYTTDMKFKNNSVVVKDRFIDENGEVHQFGKVDGNTDVDLQYMGVDPSENSRNDIKLVSNEQLDTDIITNSISGVKLSLKLDNIAIDESKGITEKSLGRWVILGDEEKIIPIIPDFGNKDNFFNISKYLTDEFRLNSSHRFVFKYGLKK